MPPRSSRPQPGQNQRPPPSSHPSPSLHRRQSLLPDPNRSPTPAPWRQCEPHPPKKSSTTCGPSHPGSGSSSAQHGAPAPSPTLSTPPSCRSAPRPRRDAPRPGTPRSPHTRPTDHSRPDQSSARAHQQRPGPPTNPRCRPTSSRCPTTAATTDPDPTPKRRPCARTHGVHIGPRPRSPRNPTAQGYEDSPKTGSANSPRDSLRHTHAHTSAHGHGPTEGQWCQRWTHKQLWELRKWARAELSIDGLVHRPRKRSAENGRRRPGGGWMSQAAWQAMLADALHPQGIDPCNLPHSRTTRMSSDACRGPSRGHEEKEGTCGTSPQTQRHAHTPPRQPARVNAQTPAAPTAPRTSSTPGVTWGGTEQKNAPQEPRAPHSMTRLTPRPAAPPPNPKGRYSVGRAQAARRRRSLPPQLPAHPPQPSRRQQTRPPAEPPRGRPSPTTRPTSPPTVAHRYPLPSQPPLPNLTPNPAQKRPSKPEADGRQHARQRVLLRPTAPKPSLQLSKPPNPPKPPSPSRSLITSLRLSFEV